MAKAKVKTRRKKPAVSGPAKTKTISGERFSHKLCGTKAGMQKRAKAHKAKGKNKKARVVKNGSKYCLYTKG